MSVVWSLLLQVGCAPEGCLSDVECGPAAVCWAGSCEEVFERSWQVEISAAEVGVTHPQGREWDGDLSPPDLFVEVGPVGASCATRVVPDSVAPVFDERCTLFLGPHPQVRVALVDDDGPTADPVAEWRFDGRDAVVELVLATAGQSIALVDETRTALVWLTVTPR